MSLAETDRRRDRVQHAREGHPRRDPAPAAAAWHWVYAALSCLGIAACAGSSGPAPRPVSGSLAKDALGPAPRPARAAPSVKLSLDAETLGQRTSSRGGFWLALRFEMPSDTHLYWSHAGESGLPTTAKFSAETAFSLGEVQYPGPTRFQNERGSTSYGYGEELALLVFVRPSAADALSVPRVFHAQAEWLACSTVCAKEQGQVSLELAPTHSERPAPTPISTWLDRRIEDAPASLFSVTWTRNGELTMLARGEQELVQFFPDFDLGPDNRDPEVEHVSPKQLRVLLDASLAARAMHGVVQVTEGGSSRFYRIALR